MGKDEKKKKAKKKIASEQMLEALRQQEIIRSLSEESKGINELQYSLSTSKSNISKKLKRLEKQGLITQHREHVEFEKLASPKYRGWRNIKEYENGSKDLEFGFELTSNGNRALEILKDNVDIEPLEETDLKKTKKED